MRRSTPRGFVMIELLTLLIVIGIFMLLATRLFTITIKLNGQAAEVDLSFMLGRGETPGSQPRGNYPEINSPWELFPHDRRQQCPPDSSCFPASVRVGR